VGIEFSFVNQFVRGYPYVRIRVEGIHGETPDGANIKIEPERASSTQLQVLRIGVTQHCEVSHGNQD